jgi:hypothetical protein
MAENPNTPSGKIKWLKRIGIIGFLFFLIKGFAWLAILFLAWLGLSE